MSLSSLTPEPTFQIAAPRRKPSRKWLATAGLLALLAVSIPINLHYYLGGGADRHVAVPQSADAMVEGHTAAAVTENYNQSFLFKDAGIDLFGAISWTLFREGRKGVLAGSDDWLFSTEEFESDAKSPERIARAVDFVSGVRDRLAARGTQLVVVTVPAKAMIYPERLGRYTLPTEPAARHGTLLAALKAKGIDVVDPAPDMMDAKNAEQLYLRTDTHWTPAGARVVAKAVADHLEGREPGEAKAFSAKTLPSESYGGDLTRYVRLGPLASTLGPQPDRLAPFEAVAEGEGSLLGEETIPVVLVGTSYSANAKWSFEPALKIALERDVVNAAAEGQGPFKPMSAYLRSDGFKTAPPKLVIWEIPDRYVDDAFADDAFQLN